MSDKIIGWLRVKVAEAAPPAVLESGSVGARVASLADAVAALRGSAGAAMLFGMQAAPDVVARARGEILPDAEAALRAWKERLEKEHGAEGAEAFATIALRYGVTLDQAAALRRDDAVAGAIDALVAALSDVPRATRNARGAGRFVHNDDDAIAWYVERRSDPLGFAQLGLGDAAPALEGLYAALDELCIGANKTGGASDSCVSDASIIEPVSRAEVMAVDDAACVSLHRWGLGRILLYRVADGAVLDGDKVVASSLAEYFAEIAAMLTGPGAGSRR